VWCARHTVNARAVRISHSARGGYCARGLAGV
jgi:hypothetical protein